MADPVPGGEAPPGYLELYKLAVEMADRISARRAAANSFFLTGNTALAAVLGGQDLRWYSALAGILFAVAWWALLRSYRDLNRAKYAVILDMETRLPAQIFGDEWRTLQTQKPGHTTGRWGRLRRYRELGRIERIVPWVFVCIYAAELVREALS